jgi:phage terminase large subunit GpA-like protein
MEKHTRELFERTFKLLEPTPDLTLSQWADEYQRLPAKTSAEPGQWKTSRVPYMREIMDAVSDINTRKIVVMSAAQVSKTYSLILNTIGYHMHFEPCAMIVMQPSIKPMAEAFSKEKLTPMLESVPVLQGKVNDKSRNSSNTILHKEFAGGYVTIVGANSPAGLRSRTARLLLADEIDGYPPSAKNEGDPLLLASKRVSTFWNRLEILLSTPTVKGLSRIELEYENSTRERWNVPCPDCGDFQELLWSQVQFDQNNLSEIRYVCLHCGSVNSEVIWKEQYTSGKFVAEFPERKARGFHLNSLASLLVEWRDIVERFIVANDEVKKGNIERMKVWVNTELGQTWEEKGKQIDRDELHSRREDYGCDVPKRVFCLTAGVDVQDDRFVVEVVGWADDTESWGIEYTTIYGDLKQPHVWGELDEYLSQTFVREDGTALRISCTFMDSGGHFTDSVYNFCKARISKRIYAIKGKGGMGVPYVGKVSATNKAKTPLFTIGVDAGKDVLFQRLDIDKPSAGYCHFPLGENRGYDAEYFKGLTAEHMVLRYRKGRAVYVWELVEKGYRKNEPLDCRNYAAAAFEHILPTISAGASRPKKKRKVHGTLST